MTTRANPYVVPRLIEEGFAVLPVIRVSAEPPPVSPPRTKATADDALRYRRLWAVFAMREDYLAPLDPFLRYIPTRLGTTFRLDLLEEKAARQAMQQPARKAGVTFADAAASALADDLCRVLVQRDAELAEAEAWAAAHGDTLTSVEQDFLESCRRVREVILRARRADHAAQQWLIRAHPARRRQPGHHRLGDADLAERSAAVRPSRSIDQGSIAQPWR